MEERALLAGADVHAHDDLALRLACWTGSRPATGVLDRTSRGGGAPSEGRGAHVHACNDGALREACGGGHLAVVNVLLAAAGAMARATA